MKLVPIAVLVSACNLAWAQPCVPLPSGAVSWWPGDGNAADLFDANDGTPMNGAGFAGGKVLQSFVFDGIDDYIEIPDHPNLYPAGSFSVEAWVRTSVASGYQVILSNYECGHDCPPCVANSDYLLFIQDGRANFEVRDSDPGGCVVGQIVPGRAFVSDGAWHQVVGTRDILAGGMNLYVDGMRDGSAALTSASDGPLGNDDGQPDPLTIGAYFVGGTSSLGGLFSGQIDEVVYINRALSPCEVKAVFDAGGVGHCRGDADADGGPDFFDNCPEIFNPAQENADGDLAGDACDCAPNDPGVFASPAETGLLEIGANNNKERLDWCSAAYSAGSATAYDVPRGSLNEFPVGTGASETCLPPGSFPKPTATDTDAPISGMGFWYLVRGRNACGVGTYGFDSNGGERVTLVCP